MTQLAVGYRDGANGRQQRSDGLMKHLGTIDAGSLRATDNQTATLKLGQGLELLYDRPSKVSYILSYDREAAAYLDLNIAAKSITLPANSIDGAALKNGSVQQQIAGYVGVTTYSTTAAPWVESAVQATGTTQGGLLRIEASVCFFNTVAGAVIYWGIGWDGAMQLPMAYLNQTTASYSAAWSGVYYATPAAGSHRFALFCGTSGGTLSINTSTYATLYVTEQKK